MQGKAKLFLYIFLIIIISAIGLRIVNFVTKRGEIEIKSKVFKIEILKNEWELAKGLSGRESLAENKGLLFVFPSSEKHGFWMRGMKFPIDIIWIDNGEVIDIKQNAPIPLTQNYETYSPSAPANYVLEINAGLSEKYGFKVGDKVKMKL